VRAANSAARHIGGLAPRVPLHPLALRAQRCSKSLGKAKAQERLPADIPQQLLDAIYDGKPFGQALRELGLTSSQVWGLTKIDDEWSIASKAALKATRRDDLRYGTNAAYVQGCVRKECREHQRVRMAMSRLGADSGARTRSQLRRRIVISRVRTGV